MTVDCKVKSLMKAFCNFHKTARTIEQTPGEYVEEFEENYSKLEAFGGKLSFNLLAVTLVTNANLPEDELQLMMSNLQFSTKLETNPESPLLETKDALRKHKNENDELVLFKKLPLEIWMNILGFLNQKELLKASPTCKSFHKLCFDPSLWTKLEIELAQLDTRLDSHIGLVKRTTKVRNLRFYAKSRHLTKAPLCGTGRNIRVLLTRPLGTCFGHFYWS